MSKENAPSHPTPADYSQEKLTNIDPQKLKDSFTEKIKDAYLPESKANYSPSEESIEHANGLDSSKANPASESTVVNSISNS